MCTITIDSGSIVAVQNGTAGTIVTVSGTVANSTSNDILVTIDCASLSGGNAQATVSGNTWTATVTSDCICGQTVTITAICKDQIACTAVYHTMLLCGCCPTLSPPPKVSPGLWTASGQQLVTFTTTLTFPAGCFVKVQRDFGDGQLGLVKTFTTSPQVYQETHAYNTQAGYTSTLNVLSNVSCFPFPSTVPVLGTAPPCATKLLLLLLCRPLQLLFLLCAAVAVVLAIVSVSAQCNSSASPLLPIISGFMIAAMITFFIVSAFCRDCICHFIWKLLGQVLLIMGMVILLFVFPTNCAQPVPFPVIPNNAALGLAVLLIAIGSLAVLYAIWHQNFRYTCPLSICDYWRALTDALIVAIVAALMVFASLGTQNLPVWPNLAITLVAIGIFLIVCYQQIQINQNSGNC